MSNATEAPAVTTDDASVSSGVPANDEGVSREAFESLKKQLDQKTRDLADARARGSVYEQRERTRISAFQPDALGFMNEMMTEADPEAKADMQPLADWAKEFHTKDDVVAQAPLARLISCASAKLKRSRDEASVHSESAGALRDALKELDETKSDRDNLRQRNGELEVLASERQAGLEKLQQELAKAGLMNDRFDFSKLTSREKSSASDTEVTPTGSEPVGITTETSNASRNQGNQGSSSSTDRLLSEISRRGANSLRVHSSGTSHHLLGSSSGDGDLMAMLRAAP